MSAKSIPERCGGHCGACDETHGDWEEDLDAAEADLSEVRIKLRLEESEHMLACQVAELLQQQVTQQAATIGTLEAALTEIEHVLNICSCNHGMEIDLVHRALASSNVEQNKAIVMDAPWNTRTSSP